MALGSGTRIGEVIGHYEILAKLGEGGMGTVYRGRDTRLGRDVAIKILPDAFASDAERLARFEREARTLASLNHPHIAQIYGVEDRALILELVEGDDLSDVIARGALPLGDALAVARQMTLALEAAHDAGIIHRDLKPANIKVRPDGTVKVLDFGLAKTANDSRMPDGSALTSPATTGLGVILGTAAYMSPEQARGRPVDRRSDLWAFGVVVFEMLSGRRMFGGDTVTDVIAAVVTREPDWSALPSTTPLAIRRLLARCLQKDPARRLRDAADARLEIEEAQHDPDSAIAGVTESGAGNNASRLRWPLLLGWAATVIAAAAVGAVAYGTRTSADAPLRILNLAIPAASAATAVLSPDGQWVAVVSEKKILVKGMRESAFREVPGTAGAGAVLAWSPNSREVAFLVDSSLKRVDMVGSRPRSICERCVQANSLRGGAWSKDDVLLLGGTPDPRAGGLLKISANGGATERVTSLETERGENSHRYPAFLPDGRRFTFTVRRDNGEHDIRVGDLGGAPPYTIASGFSSTAYADGYLLFGREGNLVALPFDAATGRPSGDPLKVADGVNHNVGTGQVAFGVGSDGTLVFGAAAATYGYAYFDRNGRKLGDVTTHQHSDGGGRLSRDYRRAVIPEIDLAKSSTDLYIVDLATGARSRLTSDPGWEQMPVWSPTGDRVAYRLGSSVYVQQVSGGKPTRVEGFESAGAFVHDWSRDGQNLLLTRSTQTGGELVRLSLTDGRIESIAPSAASASGDARLSTDGRWVAYTSGESGSPEVHVRSFPDGRVTARITTTGGDAPLWNHDGTELFYRDGEGWVTACRIRTTGSIIETGARERLFRPSLANSWGAAWQHDIDADGRFFQFRVGDDGASFANSLTVLQNWTKTLRK